MSEWTKLADDGCTLVQCDPPSFEVLTQMYKDAVINSSRSMQTAAMKAREADSAQKEIARIRSDNEKLKAHLERAGKVALHCGLVLKRLERMADVMTALGPAVDALREYDDCMISDLPSGDKND